MTFTLGTDIGGSVMNPDEREGADEMGLKDEVSIGEWINTQADTPG